VLARIAAMTRKAQIDFGSLKMDAPRRSSLESVGLTHTHDIGATIEGIGHLAVVGGAVPMDKYDRPLKKLVY
jgi:hypothetical protein